MTLTVINGPFEAAPAWRPSTTTLVRTKLGLRELGEPRTHGGFADQVAAWLVDRARGGAPQYWQIDLSERPHPEVALDPFQKGGILKFDIRLNFNVRVVDAKGVLERNIHTLDHYFTPSLRRQISVIANRFEVPQSHLLQQEIVDNFGAGNAFGNGLVEITALTVQAAPGDREATENLRSRALLSSTLIRIDTETTVTEREIAAFEKKTGGMTIDGLARAAIATGNPRLIEAYNQLRDKSMAEDMRNWERLKFLIDHKVLEPHDLEKHLGPLGDQIMRSLTGASPPAGTKMIGKS